VRYLALAPDGPAMMILLLAFLALVIVLWFAWGDWLA
jgi:hypothetical protein